MEALRKRPQNLIIVVRGDDQYAIYASGSIPKVPRKPVEMLILKPSAPIPKGAVVMFTAQKGSRIRKTHLSSPQFSHERIPEWAKGCVGMIMLRPPEGVGAPPSSSTLSSALGNAIRINWSRRERKAVFA